MEEEQDLPFCSEFCCGVTNSLLWDQKSFSLLGWFVCKWVQHWMIQLLKLCSRNFVTLLDGLMVFSGTLTSQIPCMSSYLYLTHIDIEDMYIYMYLCYIVMFLFYFCELVLFIWVGIIHFKIIYCVVFCIPFSSHAIKNVFSLFVLDLDGSGFVFKKNMSIFNLYESGIKKMTRSFL